MVTGRRWRWRTPSRSSTPRSGDCRNRRCCLAADRTARLSHGRLRLRPMSITAIPAVAEPRLDLSALAPEVYRAQGRLSLAAGEVFTASGLSQALLELIRIRVSQINGCAFCLDMHTKDAR